MNWLKEIERDFISLFYFKTDKIISTGSFSECDYISIMMKLRNDLCKVFIG